MYKALTLLLSLFSALPAWGQVKMKVSYDVNMANIVVFKDAPFTLDKQDLITIEALLRNAVDEYNLGREKEYKMAKADDPDRDDILEDWTIELNDYNRQYIPTINRKGEKEVQVNCFCDKENLPDDVIIIVHDGGDCFFNVTVNLSLNTVEKLSVNGM